mgnify:CR=1 FL=1
MWFSVQTDFDLLSQTVQVVAFRALAGPQNHIKFEARSRDLSKSEVNFTRTLCEQNTCQYLFFDSAFLCSEFIVCSVNRES